MESLDTESRAIPFNEVCQAIQKMQYASPIRVMFEMAFLTGCRIKELEGMRPSDIIDGRIYWRLGKNQKGMRNIKLPDFYLKELSIYRQTHNCKGATLFTMSAVSFRRYFTKKIRPILGSIWQEKSIIVRNAVFGSDYTYQLKGLRKTYQTLEFAKQLEKWDDAGVALEFTSKQMKHSSVHITAYHYIENFDKLDIKKYVRFKPEDFMKKAQEQRPLFDFM